MNWLQKLAATEYGSEDDLIAKIILPFFSKLGYKAEDWELKFSVKWQKGSRPGRPHEADVVFFSGPIHDEDTSLLVVEVKKEKKKGKKTTPEGQAKFYADNLKAPFYIAWEGNRFKLIQHQRYSKDRIVKEYDLGEIDKTVWTEIKSLLSKKSIVEFCEANEIKIHALFERYQESIKTYKSKIQAEIAEIDFLGRKLKLEDCYIKVRIYPEIQRKFIEESELERLQKETHPDELRRPERILARGETPKPEEPEVILSNNSRLVVVGDPGAGKTTLTKYLTMELSQGRVENLDKIPLLVEAKAFAVQKRSLWNYLINELKEKHGFTDAEDFLNKSAKAGKLTILIDGIDEMPLKSTVGKKNMKQLALDIKKISTRWERIHIIVTSRRASWPVCRQWIPASFRVYEMCEFDDDDIKNFVKCWPFKKEIPHEGLLDALDKSKPMRRLGATPLLMSLIALNYEKYLRLPDRRGTLYERCIRLLLEEWDSSRRISRTALIEGFDPDLKYDLLKEVALHFHSKDMAYFQKNELLSVIKDYLPQIALEKARPADVLEEISAQHGLLKELSAEDVYGFLHLTLQEYFTARALFDHPENQVGFLKEKSPDPSWREVILLYASMGDAAPLLGAIVGEKEDIFFSNLFFAGRCLVGTPRVSKPEYRKETISRLFALVSRARFHDLQIEAVNVLSEIGGAEIVEAFLDLLQDEKIDDSVRGNIADAIGTLGDKNVLPRLLKMLQDEKIDDSVRWNIADVIGTLGDKSVLPRLIKMLQDEKIDDSVRGNIADVIGTLGDKSVLPRLIKMLQDEKIDDSVRGNIADAIGTLGDKNVLPRLLKMLQDEKMKNAVRWRIADAIGTLGDKSVVPRLLKMLQDEKVDDSVRRSIASAIGRIGYSPEELSEVVSIFMKSDIKRSLYSPLFKLREQLPKRVLPKNVGMELSDFADIS